MLSGIRDVDREILSKLDDRELLKVCSIDKYTWNTICDDAFLRRRLIAKYPQIEKEKRKNESWKAFFLRAVHVIAKMKERFSYEYTFGNFVKHYNLLKDYNRNKNKNDLLIESVKNKELPLVIWSLKKGADINYQNTYALVTASENGYLEIVKYLVENGAKIHANNDEALRWASEKGYLEIVKYLVENGAKIHANNDEALRWASEKGHVKVVEYLIEKSSSKLKL
jgi:hypothetical protein